MSVKTITLFGTEVAVLGLNGSHAYIRNDSMDTIYASKEAGITAGADGVTSIPAGQAGALRGISDKIYLLGTGSVHIHSDDYVTSPFKISTSSGSMVDAQARADIASHEGNTDIHVTSAEKASWNAVNYSNPNLLRNPNFKVNQRGESVYNITSDTFVYTFDGWKTHKVDAFTAQVTTEEDGITLGPCTPLIQCIESSGGISEREVTLSACVDGTVISTSFVWTAGSEYTTLYEQNEFRMAYIDNSHVRYVQIFNCSATEARKISWVKLEIGSNATPFCPPDPAAELAKCQRYFCKSYLPATAPGTAAAYFGEIILNATGSSKFGQSYISFPVSMRNIPTVTIFNPDTGESGGICHSGYTDTTSASALMPGTNGFNISAGGLTQGDDYYMHYTASAEL